MPDLKTELTKVINQWNTDEEPTTMTSQPTQPTQPTHHNVTTNVTRATFEYLRDNPGKTRATAVDALSGQGLNASSVSSLIGQMIRQRLVREVGNELFTNQQEYTPLKPALSKLVNSKRAVKTKVAPRPKWAPPEPLPLPPVRPAPAPAEWSVESVIDRLNVRQAMAVYDELRKMFGA
jgi:hypothetical protein